ncbi:hypothetical protein B0H19DRAFT_1138645 [Mycena capillaripes]|nr:hypothetical protein B0H19DRAFT_1138645 [Mycena capillaripes]
MLDLPPELQEIIIFCLDNKGLWVLVQVSRRFREMFLFQLFMRHNVSMTQIYSGSIHLSGEAYFFIPMIYHIRPILKLSIVPVPGKEGLRNISSVLAAIPRIPEVEICGSLHEGQKHLKSLLATLSLNETEPMVVVGLVRPIQGLLTVEFPPLKTVSEVISAVFFFLPFVVLWIIYGVVNTCHLLIWSYHRALGQARDTTAPIVGHLGWIYGESLHVQTFVLATFSPHKRVSGSLHHQLPGLQGFTIPHLPVLSPEQSVALLDLTFLYVRADCALSLNALLSFIHRHPALTMLKLDPRAISPTSLTVEPVPLPIQITHLTSPAEYIPHFLPTHGGLVHLTITNASDGMALPSALSAIAALPDSEPAAMTVTLKFGRLLGSPTPQMLPWRVDSVSETKSVFSSVKYLVLVVHFGYGRADAQGLPRWLTQFPALLRLEIQWKSMDLNLTEQVALVQMIAETRIGVDGWEGVRFSA